MKTMIVACFLIVAFFSNAGFAADEQALVSLQKLADEYKGYTLAEAPSVPQIDLVSVICMGGLEYFTKYVGGRVGAVRLSKEDQEMAKKILEERLQQSVKQKQDSNSSWRLVVVCNKSTGAKMGGGAVWKGIPASETEEDLKAEGIHLGSGGSVQPLVTGSLYVLDTGEKHLLYYKSLYQSGWDMRSSLQAFADAVAEDFLGWASGKK